MKKFYIALSCLLCTILLGASEVQAFQIGAGVYSYCNWREMPAPGAKNVELDPVIELGPMLSLTVFKNFSISLSFISNELISIPSYGSADLSGSYTDVATGDPVTISYEDLYVTKADVDLALSYTVAPGFKVFLGMKVLEYQIMVEDSTCTVTNTSTGVPNTFNSNLGYIAMSRYDLYAIGASYSIPVAGNLYFMPNISIVAGKGTKSHSDFAYSSTDPLFMIDTETEGSFRAYGSNLALSLSYLFDSINTAVSLGARYQGIYTVYESGDYSGTDKTWEHTWGVTLSALAMMSFFED